MGSHTIQGKPYKHDFCWGAPLNRETYSYKRISSDFQSFALENIYTKDKIQAATQLVTAITLYALFHTYHLNCVDLLKVDIEGYELACIYVSLLRTLFKL